MTKSVVQVVDKDTVVIETPKQTVSVIEVSAKQPPSIIETPIGPRGPRGLDGERGLQGPPGIIEWETTQW